MVSPFDNHTGVRAPGFAGATGWLNPPAHDPARWALGPTLVDFFTYSCVNCVRTLPHLRRWHAAYGPLGLRVVGVHTPEFDFERDPANVERFLRDHGLSYPVALDADRRVWDRWANKFWPRKYLVDRRGVIRYDRIGEGGYAETERAIRDLLGLSDAPDALGGSVAGNPAMMGGDREAISAEAGVGAVCVRPTPELYAGWYRGWSGNPGGWVDDQPHTYRAPPELVEGPLTLHGRWHVDAEAARGLAAAPDAWAAVGYRGFEANAVLRTVDGQPLRVALTLGEGPLPAALAGPDTQVDATGTWCVVTAPRLYRLVAGPDPGPHVLRLGPSRPGLAIYSLTFGSCWPPA